MSLLVIFFPTNCTVNSFSCIKFTILAAWTTFEFMYEIILRHDGLRSRPETASFHNGFGLKNPSGAAIINRHNLLQTKHRRWKR